MSGGHFDYLQYRITDIADSIENKIIDNGRKLSEDELKENKRWGIYDETHHFEYPKEVIDEFKKGLEYLRIAQIYAQRIDWLLSGDDGEKSFMERLKEDLDEFKKENNGRHN